MNAGLVILPRTTDKAKAFHEGTLGEYHYGCPLDQALFRFLGTTKEAFAKKVQTLQTDEKIAEWITMVFPKTQTEKDSFNNTERHKKPGDADSKSWLKSEQKRLGRNDYSTYFDNLDVDEKRF